MILKGFQTCYGHSLFFYDKVQKPKLKENQKIPVPQHTILSSISSLAVNSYCHGFKATVKQLGIWCQSHQMALFHSAHFITNYTKLPIRYHLPPRLPEGFSHSFFLVTSPQAHRLDAFFLPPSHFTQISAQSPQEAWSTKQGAEEMCWLPNVERHSFPSLGNETYSPDNCNVDRVAGCLDAYDYDHKIKKSRL